MPHDFSQVPDSYAGSGALGIEALSRVRSTLISLTEYDACEVIRFNLARAGYSERGRSSALP